MPLKRGIGRLLSYAPRRLYELQFPVHSCFLSTATDSPAVSDSPNSDESPELPYWVKSPESKRSSANSVSDDEDFVIPSLASWVGNVKFERQRPTEIKHSVEEDKPVDDIDKISEFLKKRYVSPDSVVQALDGCGVNVNVSSDLVSQVLRRFSNEWVQAYGFFIWANSQTGYRRSLELYNSMVDVLGKCRKFDVMWELVEEMNQTSGNVTISTMTKVMRRFAKAGKHAEAMEAFRELERFGISKDIIAMNILIDALVKGHSVEHASEILLEYKDRISYNLNTYNVLIHGYCKARKYDEAWKTMDKLKKNGCNPDVVTYTSLVEAYCREKDFRRVFSIFKEMQETGCNPNLVTYTIAMHYLGKAKEVDQALGIYEQMTSNGIVPDAQFYGSLIFILSKAGRFKDAAEIFEDMPARGVTRDVLAYNTMISCACDYSLEETAFKLLKRMEEECCRPDIQTYVPLLKICCRKKRMRVLWFLLQHMMKNDVSMDVSTYILLVRGLCMSGKLAEACLFFEESVSKGMIPNDSTFKMLVCELERKDMKEAKTKIEELMSGLKVEDNMPT